MPLAPEVLALLAEARRAVLVTTGEAGQPRPVPVCYAMVDDVVWIALDEKPKSVSDVRELARVRDVAVRPGVALLVDRWSEDWTELAWARLAGEARLVEAEAVPAGVVPALRARYPQYATHALERAPMLAIAITSVTAWAASDPAGRG